MTNIFERLTRFVQRVFKTSLEIFLEALKLSPNAQGYVLGSITELLLKKKGISHGKSPKPTTYKEGQGATIAIHRRQPASHTSSTRV
jgi:hypothetical protein